MGPEVVPGTPLRPTAAQVPDDIDPVATVLVRAIGCSSDAIDPRRVHAAIPVAPRDLEELSAVLAARVAM